MGATDPEIIAELLDLAQHDPGLTVFRSRIGVHQYRGLYRLVRRHVPPGAAVLDWGAGNGHFSYFLLRAGYRATGYSFEPFSFSGPLPGAGYRFVPGSPADPVRLPFESGTFDAVASVGVLEHVRETGATEACSLGEIARVLKPGGHFVCWHFPNRHSWIDALARRIRGKHFHPYRYTEPDIRRLVSDAELELVHVRRYGVLPRNTWHRAPRALRRSRLLARAWDGLDAGLGMVLSRFAQNYAFVARKPDAVRPGGV